MWARWALATLAAMVVGGFLTGMWVAARYEARLGVVARETYRLREQLRREQAALRERASLYESLDELLHDPDTRVVPLHGSGPRAQARGRVVWLDTVGGHVFVSRLPPAPPGKVYEVWAITRGTPRAAGVLQIDASGDGAARLERGDDGVEGFTVTLEPAAGVSAPTGPEVLASPK